MSEPRGSLAAVADHLAQAVAPVDRIFRNPEDFAMVMARLGWDAKEPPASYAAVADGAAEAARAASALADGAELIEVLGVIDAIGDVYRALGDLDGAPAGVDPGAFLPVVGRELLEYLLADHFATRLPGVFWGLRALGVVAFEPVAPANGRPGFTRARFEWEDLPSALSDPAAVPADAFGWGTSEFDFTGLAEIASELFAGIGLMASVDRIDPELAAAIQAQATGPPERGIASGFTVSFFDTPAGDGIEQVGVSVTELPAEGGAHPGVMVLPSLPAGMDDDLDVGDGWTFSVRPGTDLDEQLGIVLRPGEATVRYPFAPGRPLPSGGFGASLTCASDPPRVLLGEPDGIRLELASITYALDVDADGDGLEVELGVRPDGLALVLSAGSLDSFIGSVLDTAEGRVSVPFGFSWSNRTGLGATAGAGFELSLYPGLAIGGVRVDRVDLALVLTTGQTPEIALRALAAVSGELGPISFVADGLGAELRLVLVDGNAGPFDLAFGFVPPNGLGLAVDAEVVTGGGYLEHDAEVGRYGGAAELQFVSTGLTAVGVVTTQMPDGTEGWSMFLSLGIRLAGVQLGFGFTLNGVGGLVGVNRGLDDDALGDAVRSGSLDAILFPDDPIADAPQILADIDTVFPAASDQYVFGPVVKIGWGTPTLLELDVGVAVQLPDPLTISLLGALNAVLPTEDLEVLVLHVEFAGTVNITEGTLKVDASLSGSEVAGLAITGDMAVRADFLGEPTFLVAFGGFHPEFDPPADFPALERVGVSLDTGDELRITLGGYFALTSNTVQFGSAAELFAEEAGFSAEGGTSFDALIIFKPFGFDIAIEVWVSINAGNTELMGVLLSGRLSGPNPWHAAGEAEFRLLGLKTRLQVEATFGDRSGQATPTTVDVGALLREELEREDAWSVLPPASVTPVIVIDTDDQLALYPSGRIQVVQRIVPLERTIEVYGNAEPSGDDNFALTAVGFAADDVEGIDDYFAGSQYFRLDEDEKLSSPSFTLMKAGLALGGSGVDAPAARELTYDHEIAYRDPNGLAEEHPKRLCVTTDESLGRALATRDGATAEKTTFVVGEPGYVVADGDTGVVTGAATDFYAARASRTDGAVVLPEYELDLAS